MVAPSKKIFGIVITGEDTSSPAFASAQRNLNAVGLKAREVGDSVAGLPAKFGTIGVALGAAFAGASLHGVIEVGDQLSKMSEKTGISVKELSALRYAGELANVPLEALGTGLKKMAVTMSAAAGGAKEQSAIFQALGINIKQMDGSLKGSDQMLGELADKFASFRDGPEKAALAVQIFGKAGTEMIPLLNQGSAGLQNMREEAQRLGIVFNDDLAKASEQFNDNLRKIQFSAEGAKRVIAQELLPTMNTLAEAFLETKDGSNSLAQMLGGGVRTALEASTILFSDVAFVLKAMGREIGAIAAQAVALATLDIKGFHAISDAVKEDGVLARKELDDLQRRILGVGSSLAGAGRGTAPDPRALGPVGSIREQTAGWKKAAPIVNKADTAAAAEISDYERLNKTIAEHMSAMDAELEKGRALTDMEKLEAKVIADVDHAKKELTVTEMLAIDAALQAAKAKELDLDIDKALLKQAQDTAAERQRLRNLDYSQSTEAIRAVEAANAASLKTVKDRILSLEDEETAVRLSIDNNISLAEAIERVALARLAERRAKLVDGSDSANALDLEIAERQKLITQTAAKDQREQWAGVWKDVYGGLTDSLYRGFEAGKGFFKSFWDGIKNTLKTTVLKVGVQGVIGLTGIPQLLGQTAGPLGGVFGGSGLTGAIGGIGNLMPGASSMFSNITAAYSGVDTSIAAAGILGEGVAPVAGVGGIGAAMAAIPVWGWAALGAAAIASFLGKGGAPKQGGYWGAATVNPAGQAVGGLDTPSAQLAQVAQTSINSMNASFDKLAGIFGGATGTRFGIGVSTDPQGKAPTFAEVTARNAAGQGVYSSIDLNVGRSQEELTARLTAMTTEALIAALRADNLAKPFADFFGTIAADASTEAKTAAIQIASDVASYSRPLETIGGVFAQLATLSVDAREGMIQAAGGLQALTAATASYYDNFYSAEEKRNNTITTIGAALQGVGLSLAGLDLSSTTARQQFRAMVDALDLSTAAGQRQYTALMGVAGAFASVTPALDAVTPALDSVAAAAADVTAPVETLADALTRLRNPVRSIEDIANSIIALENTGRGLQVDLLRSQGNEAGASALQRTNDTAGMTPQEVTAYYKNEALRNQIGNNNDAAQALAQLAAGLKSLVGQGQSLQAQLLRAQGNDAGANTIQRGIDTAGMSAAEVAQYDYNQQLSDQLALVQNVSKAHDTLRSAYQGEKSALQTTRDAMSGFVGQFSNLRQSLLMGDLSPLTPGQKYATAAQTFQSTVADMGSADPKVAAAAMQKFDAVAQEFLKASQAYNASGAGYQADFQAVLDATGHGQTLAQNQYDVTVESLQRLDTMVGSLIDISDGVTTVAQAIAALGALTSGAAATPSGTATSNPIDQLYQDLFGRTPDTTGRNFWNGQLQQGATVQSIGSALASSPEYQVNKIYQELFARAPDTAGLMYWMDKLNTGWSAQEVTNSIMSSPEYLAKHSHAAGLDRVPYDNYPALLHADEAVLNREAANEWRYGATDMSELTAKVDALLKAQQEANALQRQATAALIRANEEISNRAADKIVAGTASSASQANWKTNLKPAVL